MPLPGADATRPSANTLAFNLIDLKNRKGGGLYRVEPTALRIVDTASGGLVPGRN